MWVIICTLKKVVVWLVMIGEPLGSSAALWGDLRCYIALLPYTEPVKLLCGSSAVLQQFFSGSSAVLQRFFGVI